MKALLMKPITTMTHDTEKKKKFEKQLIKALNKPAKPF